MATPSLTWLRQYVNGEAGPSPYEAPITPVNTTIKTTIAGTYGTSSQGSTLQIAPTSTGDYGGKVAFTATRDLSTRKFLGFQLVHYGWPFPGPSAVIDTLANGGISIVFYDSSANWSEFYIEGNDYNEYDLEDGGWGAFRGAGISGPVQVCLERTRTPDASSGTLSWSNIDGYELIIRAIATSGNTPTIECDSMLTYDVPELVAGDSGDPAGFDSLSTFIRASNSSYQQADVFKNSAGNFNGGIGELYEPLFTYQIGDGSTVTYFRDSGGTIAEFPTVESGISVKPQLYLAGIDRGLEINTSATCDIELDGTILAAADVAGGESFVNVAGNTGATVLFNNCQFFRKTYVNFRHASATSCLFDDCEQIEIDATTVLTSATIRNTASTSNGLYTQAAAGDYTAITADFRASNAGQDITIDPPGTGTWDFAGVTVESGHTLAIHNDHVSTAITVNIAAGISYSTTTAGGTVTVTQPASTFTINSSESSSLIQIFTTATQTILDSATSNTLAYVHSAETVDYIVQKAGFIPQRTTVLLLSGTTSVDVTLIPSREYDASHGLTYTTDASWNLVTSVITGISQANPAVVTYTGADVWSNSDIVNIQDVVGMTEVNGKRYTIANINTGANTFELSGVNSSAYTAYASAGIVGDGLTVPTHGVSGQGVFSLMMDSFISETTLRNRAFDLEMDGTGSLYLTNGAEGATDASVENLISCGVGYVDLSASIVAVWGGYFSVGTMTGFTGEYQQIDGTTTTDARASGVINELIKIYGDTDHGNFDYRGHMVFKGQPNGYFESRADIPTLFSESSMSAKLYVFGLEPTAISGFTTGDPSISVTLVDHTASPITEGGESFSWELQDNGTNSATLMQRDLNYYKSQDATGADYLSLDPFNLGDWIRGNPTASTFTAERQYVEGESGLQGIWVSRGGSDHPDFASFMADNGNVYTPDVTADITISGMPTAGGSIRLQIHNETAKTASDWTASTAYSAGAKVLRTSGIGTEQTGGLYMVCTTAGTSNDTEPTWDTAVGNTTADTNGTGAGDVVWTTYAIIYYDADPVSTGLSDTYTDGEEFVGGDTYRIRFAELNAGTSFKIFETTGLVATAGFTVAVSVIANSVYATNGIDGSSAAITNIYTADYANNEIDLDANLDFTNPKSFSFVSYEQTTSQGMYQIWGAVTAIDPANYRNNVDIISIAFDETAGFVKQEDSDTSRWYKSDGTRPFKDPTTGGNGISMNWKNPVYTISTGSVLTASEKAELTQAAEAQAVNTKVGTPASSVSADIAAVPTAVENRQEIDSNSTQLAAIVLDTGTTLPAQITQLDTDVAADIASVQTDTTAIKAKTDDLTFTTANQLDSNVQYVNDVEVTGVGSEADPWGSD